MNASTTQPRSVKLERLQRHELPTGALSVSCAADERSAYVGCFDGVWNVALDNGQSSRLYAHDSYVSGVHRLPSQPMLVSAGYDGQLIWYDLTSEKIVRRVMAHQFWSWQSALSSDGKWVATVTGQYLSGGYRYEPAPPTEPTLKVFDTWTGRLSRAWSLLRPPVMSVAFSSDGQLVAAGNLMGDLAVWDRASGEVVCEGNSPDFTSWGIIKSHCFIGGVYALQFSRADQHLFAAGMGPMRDPMAGNGRQLWQQFTWRGGQLNKVNETNKDESGEGLMEALALHPDGSMLLMGGRLRGGKWNAALFDTQSGELLTSIKSDCRITRAEFCGDGRRVLISGLRSQGERKDGAYRAFGILDLWELTDASGQDVHRA